ncbi:putative lipoprotein [Corallococcus coralloides DSM 2259]|uniref:Putative lipoprotein n=1 Tax=Corallococcus coralloides (strain ATCC 25202 / DSM 2259 / NBRC 100086 / M2) TaxID=1144275 RepID=H8MZS0_CORCM|nr:lipoprotein [Corallococcus coralloides]AFE03441.1 putative lipoprotein [Corallococcus coralloides DSM 2259]
MKKQLFLGAMALGAVACTPEIAQEAPNLNVGLAEFDPSASPAVVPSPNDLAINQQTKRVNAPINPAASAAEQEFTRDYLNSLNGFPTSAIANTKIKDLDPSSVSPKTVIFIDLYQGTPLATKPVTPTLAYNEDTDLLNIIPPVDLNTGLPAWPKGSRYAVALVGGENGLKTTSGQSIIGSATWAFINSDKSLVTCEDLTSPDCGPATELIPSTETDPAKRLADQTAKSLQLEQLRRGYADVFNKALAPQGFKREDIVLIWTFSILNQPEATINLAANDRLPLIVPFPNNLIRKPDGSGLDFPVPTTPGLQQDLFTGLNTLDGFSTTGATVSENGDTTGVLDGTMYRVASDGPAPKLDPASIADGVKFFKVNNQDKGTQPDVVTCLVNNTGDCGTSVGAEGVIAVPQQLQIVPKAPLDGATEYGAVMTTDLKDEKGRNVAPSTAFALLRLANPVYDEVAKKSLISSVPVDLARLLEPRRKLLKPYFDKVAASVEDGGLGIPRSKIALGWNFTTQSTTSVLQQLYTLPGGVYGTPAAPISAFPVTSQVKSAMAGAGFASTDVGAIYEVRANTPWLLTGPFGTLNPDPTKKRDTRYPFLLFVPAGTAPTGGWPVAVFGHGLTSNRTAVLGVANSLNAAGYAVAAMDAVYHGERTSCVGSATVLGTTETVRDDGACADPATQRCETDPSKLSYGRCVARTEAARADCSAAALPPGVPNGEVFCANVISQGQCMADNKCEGGDFKRNAQGIPVISGWNFLNLGNLFTTRDNFRHHVMDFSQFLRVLASKELSDAVGGLNAAQVDYVGQSLGGIMGTMSTAVSPRVHRSVLNVAGGNLAGVLLTAPDFKLQRDAFLLQLSQAGIKPGMPAFDTFISLANTILDPADARNYAYLLENNPAAPTNAAEHRALIQYIEGDTVIPNANTLALINAANRKDAPRTVASYMYPASASPRGHSFLVYTQEAQDQVVDFLKSGAQPN